ncbi:acyl-CoA carboxylase subunit beta [Conexibacter sp. DBS9H8]|uniref:acyl-CoA carboxylase subunit beta n=1 Tax=Conexibacter sp. DBS9H8 TaxID=2937801 RepID=UPI00200EA495|nr:carboxyl transferase domain-containing protein [Conexibacter sp. DBS9H8]
MAVLADTHLTPRHLTPRERLEALCDPGSVELIRTEVTSLKLGDRAAAGDGVVGGAGLVGGRPVFCYAQDQSFLGGSLGAAHADTIVRILELAGRSGAPVVGFVGSGGARMQEGVAALAGYGRIFRATVALTGKVPQISIISGLSAGGGAYSPALTDFIIMTRSSSMFLTGPGVVREAMGEDVSADELGGPRVHERNGVAQFVVADELAAAGTARDLIGLLADRRAGAGEPTQTVYREAAAGGMAIDPSATVPASPRQVYDVRDVIASIVDAGEYLEVCSGWARNLVTAFARLDGRTVGIIANQARYLGGVLDSDSSAKGARFVTQCNDFGIPMIVLVDTPGFMPGTRQEASGVIRHGATLVRAFAAATVPRVTVILRKSFGGAYITMNSKELGADYVFAWPQSELGVMGAKPAVGIIHRRALAGADDPEGLREQLAAEYAREHLAPSTAAAMGAIDEIIEPVDTRRRLSWALRSLRTH